MVASSGDADCSCWGTIAGHVLSIRHDWEAGACVRGVAPSASGPRTKPPATRGGSYRPSPSGPGCPGTRFRRASGDPLVPEHRSLSSHRPDPRVGHALPVRWSRAPQTRTAQQHGPGPRAAPARRFRSLQVRAGGKVAICPCRSVKAGARYCYLAGLALGQKIAGSWRIHVAE